MLKKKKKIKIIKKKEEINKNNMIINKFNKILMNINFQIVFFFLITINIQ